MPKFVLYVRYATTVCYAQISVQCGLMSSHHHYRWAAHGIENFVKVDVLGLFALLELEVR